MLIASSVGVRFGGRRLFDDVHLSIARGEVIAIMGRSGSGKTTLLSCLAGLRLPSTGSIQVLGHQLSKMPRGARGRLRLQHMGFVYQSADLLPELTPVENVALPALLTGVDHLKAYEQARSLIEDLGVDCPAETAQASGGEAQRLALARALITSPALLLADEPTGSLDEHTRDEVLTLMFGRVRSRNMAAVVVTHDPAVAAYADRTISMTTELVH